MNFRTLPPSDTSQPPMSPLLQKLWFYAFYYFCFDKIGWSLLASAALH